MSDRLTTGMGLGPGRCGARIVPNFRDGPSRTGVAGRPVPCGIERAIYSTIAYRDQFDFPPDLAEIHRYLHAWHCPIGDVRDALDTAVLLKGRISTDGQHYCIVGRETLFQVRARRRQLAARAWPAARWMARVLAHVPHVRMVGVTGSLAPDNPGNIADIDFMMITEPGVMWRVRAISKVLQVIERRTSGKGLCANYHLSTKAMELADRRLYTAQELTQMIPLYGSRVYDEFRYANSWTHDFLPNAVGPPPVPFPLEDRASAWIKRPLELVAASPLGRWVEHFEARRKIKRYNETDFLEGRWSRFTREACGHRLYIGDEIERIWRDRLNDVGIAMEFPA